MEIGPTLLGATAALCSSGLDGKIWRGTETETHKETRRRKQGAWERQTEISVPAVIVCFGEKW